MFAVIWLVCFYYGGFDAFCMIFSGNKCRAGLFDVITRMIETCTATSEEQREQMVMKLYYWYAWTALLAGPVSFVFACTPMVITFVQKVGKAYRFWINQTLFMRVFILIELFMIWYLTDMFYWCIIGWSFQTLITGMIHVTLGSNGVKLDVELFASPVAFLYVNIVFPLEWFAWLYGGIVPLSPIDDWLNSLGRVAPAA
jgi:hypothetical protein